jgi:hypothetical protein
MLCKIIGGGAPVGETLQIFETLKYMMYIKIELNGTEYLKILDAYVVVLEKHLSNV